MKKNLTAFALVIVAVLLFNACRKQETAATTPPAPGQEKLVSTPAGFMPASHVYLVESGYALQVDHGHMFKVSLSNHGKTLDLGTIDRTAKLSGDRRIPSHQTTGSQPTPGNPNWITDATWINNSGQQISAFITTWVVPANPPGGNHNQIDYIFNGLENNTGTDILQPVLQYGASPAGGTSGNWYIANWYVWQDANGITRSGHSAALAVTTGTSITGVMQFTGLRPDGSSNFTSSFTGYANTLTVIEGNAASGGSVYPFIPAQNGAVQTFEAYTSTGGVPPVTDYPGGFFVAMTGIQITTAAGNAPVVWTPDRQTYGSNTIVVNNGSPGGVVHIYFRPPALPVATITSLGRRPAGGAIGSIIINYTGGTTEYYTTPPVSFNIKVTNNRLASQVITNQFTGNPLFANPPSGTITGDPITVAIQAVFTGGATGAYSANASMNY